MITSNGVNPIRSLENLKPDPDAALAFLRLYSPEHPWDLVAIPVEGGGPRCKRCEPSQVDEATDWLIKQYESGCNLYFHVNPNNAPNAKAKKVDVTEVRYLHVDLDPHDGEDWDDAQERITLALLEELPTGVKAPTFVVDSGNGRWGFWKLDDPIQLDGSPEAAEEAERYNRALEAAFEGDNCHNVDRVARLPGIPNRPNAKKRNLGRVVRPTRMVLHRPENTYPLVMFSKALPKGEEAGAVITAKGSPVNVARDDVEVFTSLNTQPLLDLGLNPVTVATIKDGYNSVEHPDGPPAALDRSLIVFHVACELERRGVEDRVKAGIFLNEAWKINDHIFAQKGDTLVYVLRQIERGKDAVAGEMARKEAERDERAAQRRAQTADDLFDTGADNITPKCTPSNIRLALLKHGVELAYDEFAGRVHISRDGNPLKVSDNTLSGLRIEIIDTYEFQPTKDMFYDTVLHAAEMNTFHPVREYLDGLEWDGVPRVDSWMTRYLGVDNTELNRAIGRLFLIAGVRRIKTPGCKFDEIPVLESAEGLGKSSALRILAKRPEWFLDDLSLAADSKKILEQTRGKWIVEVPELRGINSRNTANVKATLSRQEDSSRLAYGKLTEERPRQWIMAGTTNDKRYLASTTGNRRWWPVGVEEIDLAALKRDVDQLWGEAVVLEAAGESIRLDPSLYAAANVEQGKRDAIEGHPWFEILAEEYAGDHALKIPTADAWAKVGMTDPKWRKPDDNTALGGIMTKLGFERKQLRLDGKRQYFYVRGDSPPASPPLF